MESVAPILG